MQRDDIGFFLSVCSVSDLKPEVNYYWHHGEEVVVHGHRKGRVDPVRFQIDDHPHLQIRVPKQLPEVREDIFNSKLITCVFTYVLTATETMP